MMTTSALEGAWQIETYETAGAATAVNGVLLLIAGHWVTLYIASGAAGDWGSAEAGTYELHGDRLTFAHRQLLQGGGGREIVVTRNEERFEPCVVKLHGDRMRIDFPSGNALHLRRSAP
jgi:hypothetical protein